MSITNIQKANEVIDFDALAERRQIRPKHYIKNGIEVFDVVNAYGLDFYEGNVIKYVCRSRHKGKRLEDLIKAKTYLEYLIRLVEEEKEIGLNDSTKN